MSEKNKPHSYSTNDRRSTPNYALPNPVIVFHQHEVHQTPPGKGCAWLLIPIPLVIILVLLSDIPSKGWIIGAIIIGGFFMFEPVQSVFSLFTSIAGDKKKHCTPTFNYGYYYSKEHIV